MDEQVKISEEKAVFQETDKERKKREKAEAKEKRAQEKREAKMAGGSVKKGKKKKRIAIVVALLLVAVFIGYSVVSSSLAKNTPMQVMCMEAVTGDVEETLSTSGTVSSEESKTYYAPVGATILEMGISLGDEVKEGQQLVVFDTSDLESKKRKADLDASATANGYRSTQYQSSKNQSEYNEATVGLEELKTMAEQQEQYVKGLTYQMEDEQQREKESLQQWYGKLSQELEIQNNKLAEAQGEERQGEIQDIIRNLNQQIRDVSNQISDLSMSDGLKEKQRLIDAEQKKLEDMREEISKREGKESSSEAGITDPYAKQQQADNVQSAQLTAGEAQTELETAKEGIKAEFSGIVTKLGSSSNNTGAVLEGATVSEGTELFTIESNQSVKVDIDVTKYDLAKVAVGQKADLEIAGVVYEGEVSKINRVAQQNSQGTPVVRAEIHIIKPDSNIYLGVEAKVTIHTASAKNVITLPVEIVNADKQGDFCYVVENGVVVMRRLVTGISSDSMIEVKEGLKAGDQVIYDTSGMIMEGMNVMAVPMGGDVVGENGMEPGMQEDGAASEEEAGTSESGGDDENAATTAGEASDGTGEDEEANLQPASSEDEAE